MKYFPEKGPIWGEKNVILNAKSEHHLTSCFRPILLKCYVDRSERLSLLKTLSKVVNTTFI